MPTSSTKTKAVKKPAKKIVKKAAKSPVKKATKKKSDFKALVCAIDGECFWARDGQIFSNLADLSFAIGSMDEEVFLHHVSNERNDFADWVEHVLEDAECANALRKAEKKAQAKKIIELHLRNYSL
jgi:hypothetical protein